jgi:hypothetical protein
MLIAAAAITTSPSATSASQPRGEHSVFAAAAGDVIDGDVDRDAEWYREDSREECEQGVAAREAHGDLAGREPEGLEQPNSRLRSRTESSATAISDRVGMTTRSTSSV